jgi:hypothetical protein
VTFESGTRAFSAAAFSDAVAEAEVTVVNLQVEICGVVDDERVLRSSGDRQPLVRLRVGDADSNGAVCLIGRLDEGSGVPRLEVTQSLP